jgi:hypothetical protein
MCVSRLGVAFLVLTSGSHWLAAAELTARDLGSPKMAVLVEVNRPIQLINNPLAGDVWNLVRETNGLQQFLASPDADRFRQALKFIEKSLGTDWQTGVARLTAGGIIVAVQPKGSAPEPGVTVVLTAADESTLRQFIEAVQAELRRSAAAGNSSADSEGGRKTDKPAVAETKSYRTFSCQRVGNGWFAIAGRQLIVSNGQPQLEAALDRVAGAGSDPPFDIPTGLKLLDGAGKAPAIQITANVGLLREDAKAQAVFKLPANDPIPVLLIGGYLDLLRRSDFAAAGLFVDGPAHEIRIRFPVGTDGAYAGLRGYFASDPAESAPRLLQPTGAIFSAGWFRDYKKLWDARTQLLNAELVQQLEKQNEKGKSEGLHFGISDLVDWIGPHFRLVAARQRETVYQKRLDERLPAFAAVVGTRDETAMRDRILGPLEGLLLVAAGRNIEDFKKIEHRGVKLTTFRFTEKLAEGDPGKAVFLNFNPAWALARGQLIIGSTAEIVRDLIDELDRSETATGPQSDRPTDRQQVSLAEVSEFLMGFQERFVRGAMLEQGLTLKDAARDLEIFHKVLKRLGTLTTTNMIGADHFEIGLRLGPAAQSP